MTNAPAVLWDDMTKQARIAACEAMSHRTYEEMQKVMGANANKIRRFFIENSIKKQGARMTDTSTYADLLAKAAPLWGQFKTNKELARHINEDYHRLQAAIQHARWRGDERFPTRISRGSDEIAAVDNLPYRPLKLVDDDALERAFLRETHPDGTPYTKDDIFAAMAGFADRPVGGFRHTTTRRKKHRFIDPTLSLPDPALFADGG